MSRIRWPIFVFVLLVTITAFEGYPSASAQSRTLYGFVYSAATGQPIAATVTVSQCFNQQSAVTAADGSWQLSFPYGTLGTITFSAPGYVSETFQLNMNAQWYYAGGIVSLQS
jgi:hypothetical protein